VLAIYKESELIAAFVYIISSSITYDGAIPCFTCTTIWVSDNVIAHDILMRLKDFLCSINIYCAKATSARKGSVSIFDPSKLQEGVVINELDTSDIMVYFDKSKNITNFIVRR
jgi:hypothetical protein